jgi:AraC family transcriptional regulator, activator of mtrCDE
MVSSGQTVQFKSLDTLSGLAPLLRVRPELQYACRFGADWTSDHPPESDAWAPFHIVTHGVCMLHLHGHSVPLGAGDVAVLPHGSPHILHGSTTAPRATGPFGIRSNSSGTIPLKTNTDDEPDAQLLCGRLKFDHASHNLVLSALPEAIVVTSAHNRATEHMRALIELVKEELDAGRPGSSAVAADLASALLVMVVRTYLETERAPDGLLSLLSHAQAGRAVAAMLDDPARPWTLDELADCANASRATLVRMFRKMAQVSPLAFLTELRLDLAKRKLHASNLPLAAIGAELGYQSESAFSRAFQRRYGVRPGEARMRS